MIGESKELRYNGMLKRHIEEKLKDINASKAVRGADYVLWVTKQIYFAKYGKRFRQGYHDFSWEEYVHLKQIVDYIFS